MQMSIGYSRVLHVNLSTGKSNVINFDSRARHIGGSGLAAALYEAYGTPAGPCDALDEPLIFAIGPLTGAFPVMTKVVCAFRSPYTEQWAESHAGGRLGLSLRFSGYDALMITGRAPSLSALVVGARSIEIKDVHYLRGRGVFGTGRELRRLGKSASGHRSTLRIGPAGENGISYACINVDSFRHFGRLGAGAVMGGKNLKGIVVLGDGSYSLPEDAKAFNNLYKKIFTEVTTTSMMQKYHNLGTPENLEPLNAMQALPWRNLQATTDPAISTVTGAAIAENFLLRKSACAGCPVGCIHIANLRMQFGDDHEYLYKQVSYDYELIFAQGTMLGLSDPQEILPILDETESCGLDCMSSGVALAWATEALEKGVITEAETLLPLAFGTYKPYLEALRHLTKGTNEFWQALGKGTLYAAKHYGKGSEDYACVLGGQEMAGYATGEAYYVSHALGFRHSHLDSGGYSFDQSDKDKNVDKTTKFLVDDEHGRVLLNCMVGCMFARKVYSAGVLQEALTVMGFKDVALNLEQAGRNMQALRWKLKFATGYVPEAQAIPQRFMDVRNWKGQVDPVYLEALRTKYAQALRNMAESAVTSPQ
ncbi:MAG: aldehyde ferredoxin oxidoreductase N-terminal domain-containing protein [Desulfovibrionaceae bacterium]